MALSLLTGTPWQPGPKESMNRNPLVGNYETKDGRFIMLTCLQAGVYWPPLCDIIGRPELASDPRFVDHEALMEHREEAADILTGVFKEATVHEWRVRLEPFIGQWTVI